MAAINDNANIFVGGTLELFNRMQVLVARDGDVAYAQQQLKAVMVQVCETKQDASASSTGSAVVPRPQ